MRRWMLGIALPTAVILIAVWFDASPLLRGPAPFPPEWRWPFDEGRSVRAYGGAALCGAGLLGLLLATGRSWRAEVRGRIAAALLALATLLGAGLQTGLLVRAHPAGALAALVWRTEHPMFTGYYTVAASDWARDPLWYLRNHAESIEALRDHVRHVQTHPPGAVLFYRAVIALSEAVPPVAAVAARPYASAQVETLVPNERDEARRAAALLAPLILMTLGAATAFAVASMARSLGLDPLAATRIGILWTAVPASALMVPEIDQLLTFLGAAAAALFWLSLRRRGAVWAVVAGGLAGASVFVSYGSAVYVAFGFAVAAVCAARTAAPRPPIAAYLGLSALGACIFWLVPTLLGNDPFASAHAALGTHFDDSVHLRSYAVWLLFNLTDLAFFVSLPVVFLGLQRLLDAVRRLGARGAGALADTAVRLPVVVVALLLVLDASGVVRGETGRSWMPLMPFLVVAALVRPADREGRSLTGPGVRESAGLVTLLLVQTWVLRTCWMVP